MVFGTNSSLISLPLVTVIIGTKDRPELILRAVNTILNQTYSNIECLVIDSSNTNRTQELIEGIKEKKISYFRLFPDPGRIASLNFGIEKSIGKYICFLDDDDEYMPEKIELQVQALNNSKENVGMAYCWAMFFDESKNEIAFYMKNTISGYAFPDALESMAFCSFPALMLKKDALLDIMFSDESGYPSDWLFVARFTKKYHVVNVPKVLVKANINHMYDRMSAHKIKNKAYYIRNINFHIHFFDLFEADYRLYPKLAKVHLYSIISSSAYIKHISKWIKYSKKALELDPGTSTYNKILRSIGTLLLRYTK